ncbi:MAG: VOC family protein [Labilithrix sp.]|nr:VOC family protein [Labilithrix sp.]MCW5814694.1 VOC family protein [Labilithrix sp.]
MRIHHLALRTDDLAALERFYAGVLGLAITRRNPRSLWLDAGGTILMLEERDPDEPRIDPTTKELLCFALPPAARDRFATSPEIEVEARTDFTLYFRDPDGRRIAVSSYPQQ